MSEQFVVKSRFREYTVEFSEDLQADLAELPREGDVFLVDRTVRKVHAARLDGPLAGWPTIELRASEGAKSFEEIGHAIEML